MTTRRRFSQHMTRLQIESIPTHKLQEIVDNDGTTSHGTDYGPILSEIVDILNERKTAKAQRDYALALKAQKQAETAQAHVCTQCALTVPRANLAALDALFYRRPDQAKKRDGVLHRHLCKQCMRQRETRRHFERKITNEQLPF